MVSAKPLGRVRPKSASNLTNTSTSARYAIVQHWPVRQALRASESTSRSCMGRAQPIRRRSESPTRNGVRSSARARIGSSWAAGRRSGVGVRPVRCLRHRFRSRAFSRARCAAIPSLRTLCPVTRISVRPPPERPKVIAVPSGALAVFCTKSPPREGSRRCRCGAGRIQMSQGLGANGVPLVGVGLVAGLHRKGIGEAGTRASSKRSGECSLLSQ
jgi:hypothetical protein